MGIHRARRCSTTGALDWRKRKGLGSRYVGAIRGQVHQYLRDTLIVVLVHITFRRNGSSSGRLVDRTDNGTTGTNGFRTLTPWRVGVDPERGLTIVWWSVDVHGFLFLPPYAGNWPGGILPFAVAFRIRRTGGIRWFGFFLPLRTSATAGNAVFLHLHTRVRRKVWTWRPLGVRRRRMWSLAESISYALGGTVMRWRAAAKVRASVHRIIIAQFPWIPTVIPWVVPPRRMRFREGLSRGRARNGGFSLGPRGRV